jgi:hypothetical protein
MFNYYVFDVASCSILFLELLNMLSIQWSFAGTPALFHGYEDGFEEERKTAHS